MPEIMIAQEIFKAHRDLIATCPRCAGESFSIKLGRIDQSVLYLTCVTCWKTIMTRIIAT